MKWLPNITLVLTTNINNFILVKRPIYINKKIKSFNKTITVTGDKSLSIRFAILASLAKGKSKAKNILLSEDVISTINCLRKLGVKIKVKKNYCEVIGKGSNGYNYKNNLTLDAGNSGTTARLLASVLVNSPKTICITGDNSLKKRDMKRIIDPLKKFGAKFKKNNGTLPLYIRGSNSIKSINYEEYRASAQCKTAVCLAALHARGITKLKCKPSRDHTEILFKYLEIPIKIRKTKNFDYIEIKQKKDFKSFNYNIPGDPSSSSFLIILALLSKNSKITIKNVNINPTRIGMITVLKMMGASIEFKNKRTYKGEKIASIVCKSTSNLRAVNLPQTFNNSSAIDEFILIFICSAFAKGISIYRGLEELNQKESKRLDWGFKILKMIGIKTRKISNNGIKIYGNPNLRLDKLFIIKNYLKDHRVAMSVICLALAKGGKWKIHDPDSFKTSFPSFIKTIKELGGKIN